ncbi:MAG: phage Gp37/Gp68 family protein [Bacteroidales bacterium]|nr:phage Gp37/Gp68 family protein [Bacteroidales bacterium]
MKKHKIDWTDETWNPVWGCNAGCSYCYARNFSKRFAKIMASNEVKNDISINGTEKKIKYIEIFNNLKNFKPTFLIKQFNNEKKIKGCNKKIFVGSMTDIAFWQKDWIDIVLNKIEEYPQHTFQILTKFPEKIYDIKFPQNVWLGISAENQKKFEKRVNKLIDIKAGKHFISLEPLQNEIKIDKYILTGKNGEYPFRYVSENFRTRYIHHIDWVIVGGQTGNNAIEIKNDWVISILNACKKYDTPLFFKSWGTGGNLRGDFIGLTQYKNFPT